MKIKLLLITFLLISAFSKAQSFNSPEDFLGYKLGEKFTRHHQVLEYFKHLETSSKLVKIVPYGLTNEDRKLQLIFISSSENLENLESIRKSHLQNTGIIDGPKNNDKVVVWLSYNVHGNESSSTEASMKTAYILLKEKISLLKDAIIIIDPSINPDGRDRYVNFYKQSKSSPNDTNAFSREHHESWQNGRTNHYIFDLNRDWAWITQIESKQRLKIYNKWMPHVHVDYHEQSINNPYYFAPAAEPLHNKITDFQKSFQNVIAKNHAEYFDKEGWLYFSKQTFDLLYPSYGDSYPMFMGAIGMTYEQAGGGRAGLGVVNNDYQLLTLKDRIDHHFTTGISTIEISVKNKKILNENFYKFFFDKKLNPKSYLIEGNSDVLFALSSLLEKHEIKTSKTKTVLNVKGYDYQKEKNINKKIKPNALLITTNQPKGTMVEVLLEPKTTLNDSLTYDITAWSLPYAYGLETISTNEHIDLGLASDNVIESFQSISNDNYGFGIKSKSFEDSRFLASLLQKNIHVRYNTKPLINSGTSWDPGSLFILRGDNKHIQNELTDLVNSISILHSRQIIEIKSGYSSRGVDLGSKDVKMLKKPLVGILGGENVSPYNYGEIWHFFEKQLNYPLVQISEKKLNDALNSINTLILPSGSYDFIKSEEKLNRIISWVKSGGKIIAIGRTLEMLTSKEVFELKTKKQKTVEDPLRLSKNNSKDEVSNSITGSIYKVNIDKSHYLNYGLDRYYTLKLSEKAYNYLPNGYNAGYLADNAFPTAGFVGYNVKENQKKSLVYGEQQLGKGSVIYFVDNLLFRGFWYSGKIVFSNSIFYK